MTIQSIAESNKLITDLEQKIKEVNELLFLLSENSIDCEVTVVPITIIEKVMTRQILTVKISKTLKRF